MDSIKEGPSQILVRTSTNVTENFMFFLRP